MDEIAATKVGIVGLPEDAGQSFRRSSRAACASEPGWRAPGAGSGILVPRRADCGSRPIAAAAFDRLIGDLKASLGLTVVMATHDLDTLFAICDRVAVLVDKKVRVGTLRAGISRTHIP